MKGIGYFFTIAIALFVIELSGCAPAETGKLRDRPETEHRKHQITKGIKEASRSRSHSHQNNERLTDAEKFKISKMPKLQNNKRFMDADDDLSDRKTFQKRNKRAMRNDGRRIRERRDSHVVGKKYPWHIVETPKKTIDPWLLKPSIHLVPQGGIRQEGSYNNGTLSFTWVPMQQSLIKLLNDQRTLEVGTNGLYFIYAQIHYNWEDTSRSMGHCINIGDSPTKLISVMCSRTAADVKGTARANVFRNVNTNYVGGALYLRKGAFISVTMFRETGDFANRPNTILTHNDFTFFGAYMIT